MKKYRLISLLLSLLFLLQAALLPVSAEPIAESDDAAAGTIESSDSASPDLAEPETQYRALPTPSELDYESDYSAEAKAALLIELNSNTVLYAQNADDRLYPASLTKIMTCLIALERGNLDDVVTVSSNAFFDLDVAGSNVGLQTGEQLTLRELLYCALVASANEACNVIAEYIAGDVAAFVELMNEEAAALGCKDTHFANAHGLHEPEHYTTARDLAIIARVAWQNETFREIANTTVYTVPPTNLSDERVLATTNYLISTATTDAYYYSKASGVKTGYTSYAGRCLISTADNGKLSLLSVVLGAETTEDENGRAVLGSFVETKKLFEYGFDNFVYTKVLSVNAPLAQVPVALSAGADSVVIKPAEDIYAMLPREYEDSQLSINYSLDAAGGLEAPLAAEQRVGRVSVTFNGKEIGSTSVVTLTAVERSELQYTVKETKSFFARYWWVFLGLLILLVLLVVLRIWHVRRMRAARRRQRQIRHENRKRGL